MMERIQSHEEVSNSAEEDERMQALLDRLRNEMKNGFKAFIDRLNKEHCKMLSEVPSQVGSMKQVGIFWDIENCGIPANVRPEDVSNNTLAFLKRNTKIDWEVINISAYADFSTFSRKVRLGCQRTGVELIDTPNVKKGGADTTIIVALFEYSRFYPPPSSIMLITGDVDFAHTLHKLQQWGHNIFLVIPSGVRVSSALTNASVCVWDWFNVVRGEDHVPTSSSQIKERSDAVTEELFESVGFLMESQLSFDDGMPVQPGDLTGLKDQLVKLLESSGGRLRLVCLASQYHKRFRKPLRVSDFKAPKLVDLLEKISDVLSIEGHGREKVVILKK